MTAKSSAKRPPTYANLIEELRLAQNSLIKPRKNGAWRWVPASLATIAGLAWYFEANHGIQSSHSTNGATPDKRMTPALTVTSKPEAPHSSNTFALEIAALPPEAQAKRVIAKIKDLNRDFDADSASYSIENGAVFEVSLNIAAVTDLSPLSALVSLKRLRLGQTGQAGLLDNLEALRGLSLNWLECHNTSVSDLGPLHGMPLKWLVCSGSRVSDLTPLQGCPLEALGINDTAVTDLKPLRNMPLKFLNCGITQIEDLTPLKGIPLTDLNCMRSHVRDLSPLAGMRLTRLICSQTFVEDLSPLRGMPLKELDCDYNPTRDAQILHAIPTLEKVNSLPVADFWKNQ